MSIEEKAAKWDEAVRCGECLWWDKARNAQYLGFCQYLGTQSEDSETWESLVTNRNGFCAWGDRRRDA